MIQANRSGNYSRRVLIPAALLLAATAFADDNLKPPPEGAFLAGMMKVADNWVLDYLTYEQWEFPAMNGDEHPRKRGRHWRLRGDLEESNAGPQSWIYLRAGFLKAGWTVAKEVEPDVREGAVHYVGNGQEAWATVDINGSRVEVHVIEIAPVPVSLTLRPPAPTPETMDPAEGDFPYLGPTPGSTFRGGVVYAEPFRVTPKTGPLELVASGTLRRSYGPPVSNVLFQAVYKPALLKAGWELVRDSKDEDASLLAHYTKNGRNIWAELSNDANGYLIEVADAGAKDLAVDLKKSCHVALYGVLFDFNKSTLQPVSDPVLQKTADLLAADKTLKVEVQGHTDNVGADDYNQTLSEARAKTVADWLAKRGVAADRLSAKGYGKTMPVADNDSDEGRAKNRRVEIATPACTPAK